MTGTKSVAGHEGSGLLAGKPRGVLPSLAGAAAAVSVAALLTVLPAAASLGATRLIDNVPIE